MKRDIVLASASPRRRELLPLAFGPGEERGFAVRSIPCDESYDKALSPQEIVMGLARKKAQASAQEGEEGEVVVGCDTLVFLDGKALGKPRDRADAFRMLKALSGRSHEVYTGVCLLADGSCHCDFERTVVTFYPLEDALIEAYVNSGEPMDKAGAYGIQGAGSVLVRGIEGCYFNVVGLPVAKLYRMLAALEAL